MSILKDKVIKEFNSTGCVSYETMKEVLNTESDLISMFASEEELNNIANV